MSTTLYMTLDHLQRLRMYKTAVALNNVGVSLLERHRYSCAMQTFKDALDFIRATLDEEICSRYSSALDMETRISNCLRVASRRLTDSFQETQNITYYNIAPTVTVLSGDQSFSSAFDFAQNLFKSATGDANVFAIRIDDSQSQDANDAIDLESASILHNFATACLCHVRSNPSCRDKSYQRPYKIFHRALIVLSRRPIVVDREVDDLDALRILTVSALVVKGLVDISVRLCVPNDANSYHKTLCFLQEAFFQLKRFPHLITLMTKSHAAVA